MGGTTVEVVVGSGDTQCSAMVSAGGTWEKEVGDIDDPGGTPEKILIEGDEEYAIRSYIKIGADGGTGTDITLFGQLKTQITPPAVPQVLVCAPIATFKANNIIELCGKYYRSGSGGNEATEVGFFISEGAGTNLPPGNGNADYTEPVTLPGTENSEFTFDFDYGVSANRGKKFYFNPYVKTAAGGGTYYYTNNQTSPPTGQTFTIPKVENEGLELESVASVSGEWVFYG